MVAKMERSEIQSDHDVVGQIGYLRSSVLPILDVEDDLVELLL